MRVGTRPSPAVTKATTTPTIELERPIRKRRPSRVVHWLLLPFVVCATACTAAAPPPVAPAPPERALHNGPLTDFVSAAGLHWLVLVKPKQALANAELGPAIERIVPAVRFDAFEEASGVDLRQVPSALVAGFPYSTMYLAELPTDVAAVARARFSERLWTGAVTKRPRPTLTRITGVIGQTPETLLTVDDRVIVTVGDPVQAKIAEAYAQERLKHSPTALRGAALSSLPELANADDVAVLYAPGPFADEWQRAAGGLLQSAVALAITVRPIGGGKLATTVYVTGAWQDSADAAAAQLSAAWGTFARSSAGHLFDLNPNGEAHATPQFISLRVEIEIDTLVRGLRASVLGDLSQILRMPGEIPNDAAQTSPHDPSLTP